MSNFWDVLGLIFSTFVFVAYLMVMFQVIVDLFRDQGLSGGWKAIWILGLVFLPVFTALIYVIARGTIGSIRAVSARFPLSRLT